MKHPIEFTEVPPVFVALLVRMANVAGWKEDQIRAVALAAYDRPIERLTPKEVWALMLYIAEEPQPPLPRLPLFISCPRCATVSHLVLNPSQAFCPNETCDVITFNPSLPDGGMNDPHVIEVGRIRLKDETR